MNEFRKNLLKTSLTLMIIAGGASLLVGATNAITAPVIEQNSIEKERKQLSKVYDTADAFIEWKVYSSDEKTKYKSEDENGQYLSTLSLNYVQKVWTARKTKSGNADDVSDEDDEVGYIARVYGKNGYGAVDFLIGITLDGKFSTLCEIEDSMSYKSKLESGYIDPFSNASSDKKDEALDNVKCGATFAANLLRSALLEAKDVCMKKKTAQAVSYSLEEENHYFQQEFSYAEERR